MSIKVNIDGQIFERDEARVSVFDRGFLYGDSVFEVMRTYHGIPCRESDHLERLQGSCDRVLIQNPWSQTRIREEVSRTLAAAENEESYIRIIVTRGGGPLNYDPTTAESPQVIIIVTPLKPQPRTLYEDGVDVCLVRASRPTDDSQATGAKASNYLVNLLATHEVRQRGGYVAILLGPSGQILEGATSNIFIVRDGLVRTPRAEAGILVGITRQTVIEVSSSLGLQVEEKAVFPQDLYDADEAFITSSLREVVGVVGVDGRRIGTGKPGPVTRDLHRAYLDAVRNSPPG